MKENQTRWGLAGILLGLSVMLRLFRVDMSFWMDEIITITQFVPKPWLKIITEVPYPNNHILYTLLAKLCILIFGESEWSARLPAVLFGSITPPIFYLLLRKRFSEIVAFSSGLFLALNYWSVWFSQDARGYSAFILLSFLSSWLFLEYLENGARKIRIAYILVSVLCVWFYLYTLFLSGAQLLYALNRLRRKRIKSLMLIPVFVSALLGISIYIPGLPQLWRYAQSADKMSALHPVNLLFFKDLLFMLAGTRKLGSTLFFVIIALPGLFYLLEKERGLIVINLLAAFGIILFSAIFHFFIYPRFLSFLLPMFALAVGLCVKLPGWIFYARSIRLSKALSYLLMSVMVLLLIPGLVNYYAFGKQGFKDSAEYLRTYQQDKQLICYGIICDELRYYYKGAFEEKSEKGELTREMIQGRRIISRQLDWRKSHFEMVQKFCYAEKIWRSSGYKENTLILYNCQ